MVEKDSASSDPHTSSALGSADAKRLADDPVHARSASPRRAAIREFLTHSAWLGFRAPLIVLASASVADGIFLYATDDATSQIVWSWRIMRVTAILLLIWWLFISRLSWRRRLCGVGMVAAMAVAFIGVFRVKEFSGAMIPRFEYRWQPSGEQRAASYWAGLGAEPPGRHGRAPSAQKQVSISAADWPHFHGPQSDGTARGVRIATDWDRHPPRLLWRHPVGPAWSSFAVAGDYAFTQEQRANDEAVVCYDSASGEQIWIHLDLGQRFASALAGVGPRATPTIFDGRVYAFGALGRLNCLEACTGRLLWSVDAVADAGVGALQFGMSGSPLVYDKLVIVNPGGTRLAVGGAEKDGRALAAYDRISGKQVWAAGDYQAAYSTPLLAMIQGAQQIIIFDALGAGGHDPKTGKELWRSPLWTNSNHQNIAQPLVLPDNSVFLSSGYGTGSMLLEVRKSGGEWMATPRWTAPNRFKLKFNSGVLHDGCVYGLDEGILACLDVATGRERWKRGRYGYGQVLLLDDALLVLSEEGDAILVDISPAGSHERARFHAIDGKTWNHPAMSRGRLFVRNAEQAACFDLRQAPSSDSVAEEARP